MKNFDNWNTIKKHSEIFYEQKTKYFKKREVWLAKVGLNLGCEEDGKGEKFVRPILILKRYSRESFLGIPLSTVNKDNKYYFTFDFNNEFVSALISQIKFFDRKRLVLKIGKVKGMTFEEIRKATIEVNFQ